MLADFNFAHPLQLLVEGSGDAWVMMQLCGGASCSGPERLYRIHDGGWSLIADSQDWSMPFKKLALDGSGRVWLFWEGAVYRLEGESMNPAASITAHGAGVGPDGKVWVVAEDEGEAILWVLEP
jgi:hypothetical protein